MLPVVPLVELPLEPWLLPEPVVSDEPVEPVPVLPDPDEVPVSAPLPVEGLSTAPIGESLVPVEPVELEPEVEPELEPEVEPVSDEPELPDEEPRVEPELPVEPFGMTSISVTSEPEKLART